MKAVRNEECVDSDAPPTSITEWSSESEDVEHHSTESPASTRFSLSDARFTLAYVKRRMQQQEVSFRYDEGCEILAALNHYRRRGRSSETGSCFDGFRTQSSFRLSQTSSISSSSGSYSSFQRPEQKAIPHRVEILGKGNNAFNIYSRNVDLAEHSVSVSTIEDAPVEIVPAVHDDCRRAPERSSKVKLPSLPPTRPDPPGRHTVESQRTVPCQFLQPLAYHPDDDEASQISFAEKWKDVVPSVVGIFENSDGCSSSFGSASRSSGSYSSFQRPETKVIHHKMDILSEDNVACNIYSSNVDFVDGFQTQSSLGLSQTSSISSSSRSYSSFRRPEKKVAPHRMEILSEDNDAFNIYSSDVDFVERSVSISAIEDAPARIAPAADRSPRVKFPPHPPTRPPPLQRHAAESRKLVPCQFSESLASHPNDDEAQWSVTEYPCLVVWDFENSNN